MSLCIRLCIRSQSRATAWHAKQLQHLSSSDRSHACTSACWHTLNTMPDTRKLRSALVMSAAACSSFSKHSYTRLRVSCAEAREESLVSCIAPTHQQRSVICHEPLSVGVRRSWQS